METRNEIELSLKKPLNSEFKKSLEHEKELIENPSIAIEIKTQDLKNSSHRAKELRKNLEKIPSRTLMQSIWHSPAVKLGFCCLTVFPLGLGIGGFCMSPTNLIYLLPGFLFTSLSFGTGYVAYQMAKTHIRASKDLHYTYVLSLDTKQQVESECEGLGLDISLAPEQPTLDIKSENSTKKLCEKLLQLETLKEKEINLIETATILDNVEKMIGYPSSLNQLSLFSRGNETRQIILSYVLDNQELVKDLSQPLYTRK